MLTCFKLLRRVLVHKFWVAYYCFQVGLYWQGIVHDLSKFSWTEFSRSIKYWDDKISSLANERNINGYSETFLHHRGRNPHHYEYWIHSIEAVRWDGLYFSEQITNKLNKLISNGKV